MSAESFLDWLRRRRRGLEDSLAQRERAHTLSLARYRLHGEIRSAIHEHARGDCLDAGSGRSPYQRMLEERADNVTSIDIEDRSGTTDVLADLQSMPQLADGSFDTVLCSQVLEHVPRPWDAVAEMGRVLRPGGVLILTVPHLSVIHEAPHDYYRYTEYGLGALCRQAGLAVLEVRATGGLLCFLLHGVSAALLSTLGGLPLLRWPTWALNYVFLVRCASLVDRVSSLQAVYPCDYVVVARKGSSDRSIADRSRAQGPSSRNGRRTR